MPESGADVMLGLNRAEVFGVGTPAQAGDDSRAGEDLERLSSPFRGESEGVEGVGPSFDRGDRRIFHAADPTTPNRFADWLAQPPPPDTVRALLRDLGR